MAAKNLSSPLLVLRNNFNHYSGLISKKGDPIFQSHLSNELKLQSIPIINISTLQQILPVLYFLHLSVIYLNDSKALTRDITRIENGPNRCVGLQRVSRGATHLQCFDDIAITEHQFTSAKFKVKQLPQLLLIKFCWDPAGWKMEKHLWPAFYGFCWGPSGVQ